MYPHDDLRTGLCWQDDTVEVVVSGASFHKSHDSHGLRDGSQSSTSSTSSAGTPISSPTLLTTALKALQAGLSG